MSSLRERRRKRTTETIRRAAIELAYDLGIDGVTTDMISEAAGISPRTFFNYFPYKEAAMIPPAFEFSKESIDSFVQGRGDLLEDITKLLLPMAAELKDKDIVAKSHELSRSSPKLSALRLGLFVGFDNQISTLIQQRLGATTTESEARHMAGLVSTSARLAVEDWLGEPNITAATSISAKILAIKSLFSCPFPKICKSQRSESATS